MPSLSMPSSTMPSISESLALSTLLLGLSTRTIATGSNSIRSTVPAAVFQDSSASLDGQFVFAVNLHQPNTTDNATSDLYLHMSAPSTYQWMGVGLGRTMDDGEGTVMWIAYPSQNGTGLTLSVRLGYEGHREPSYTQTSQSIVDGPFGCEQIWGDDMVDGNKVTNGTNGTMTPNAVCRNVPTWNGS